MPGVFAAFDDLDFRGEFPQKVAGDAAEGDDIERCPAVVDDDLDWHDFADAADTADFIGLIRLDSVTPVDLAAETTKAAREALAAQSQQGTAQDAYDLFTAAMTAQGGLTIDQSVITAVQAQLN